MGAHVTTFFRSLVSFLQTGGHMIAFPFDQGLTKVLQDSPSSRCPVQHVQRSGENRNAEQKLRAIDHPALEGLEHTMFTSPYFLREVTLAPGAKSLLEWSPTHADVVESSDGQVILALIQPRRTGDINFQYLFECLVPNCIAYFGC